MAWETALDRLILRQIHLAERGEARPEEVRAQIVDLAALSPKRAETAFHAGYAQALLGVELPAPDANSTAARRWHTFGRLRGHDRLGENNWVADLVAEPIALMDLLGEPRIATQVLPLVMRTLFWSGDLGLAVKAIDYLSTTAQNDDQFVLVEAALADLLTRLENREDTPEGETTASILQRCVDLACFSRLPDDVRAGYLLQLGNRLLAVSEFGEALERYTEAFGLAIDGQLDQSRIALGAALANLRLHEPEELTPQRDRVERDAANEWLARIGEGDAIVPEAHYVRGMLAYESGDLETSIAHFDHCTQRFRRVAGRDAGIIARNEFFLAAALLMVGAPSETARALRLMDGALEHVRPDLESFYSVHEALKSRDRRLALRFLDAVDVGRGTAPDQLLFVALEYLSLGEAQPAQSAAERVLAVATDLDQRIEAMRVLLTAHNMTGNPNDARGVYQDIRELLLQRGAFSELENLLKNEESVGQALDHVEVKCELVALYEEMEDRELDKAMLQQQIARSLRARKDVESLREAQAILREIEIGFPELAEDDLKSVEGLLRLAEGGDAAAQGGGAAACEELRASLGHAPRILVVGGNERQRRHHPRFEELASEWGFSGEWLMANYTSPQKLVSTIGEQLESGIDLLVLLHWNRHETTEPALELARKAEVPARTVHYAGFTSLQVALEDQLEKLTRKPAREATTAGGKSGRGKNR